MPEVHEPKPPSSIQPSFASPTTSCLERRAFGKGKIQAKSHNHDHPPVAIDDVLRDVKIPRSLRSAVANTLVKMESSMGDANETEMYIPRHRTYVGNNFKRFKRDKTPMRKPKSLHGVPVSVQKLQRQEMREHAAAERQRAAMEVYMYIQSKKNSFAMNREAAAKIAEETEKMSLTQLKIKNLSVMCSIKVIKKGLERALNVYKSIELAAKAELQRQIDAANKISNWWWDVMMANMSRAMNMALMQRMNAFRDEQILEDMRFLQTMANRMQDERRAFQVWRAKNMVGSRQRTAHLTLKDLEEEHEQSHNSVLYPKKYREMLAAKIDEKIDIHQRGYQFSVAPSDTFQEAVDRIDKKYHLGIGRKMRAKKMMMSRFSTLRSKSNGTQCCEASISLDGDKIGGESDECTPGAIPTEEAAD